MSPASHHPIAPAAGAWGPRAAGLKRALICRLRLVRPVRACAAAASAWVVLLAGCGLAANPQPPTLWLPAPVKDLTATRAGDEVHLHWTMPKNTTDKVTLRGDQRAHFCWADPATSEPTHTFDPKTCNGAGDALFPPEKAADFSVKMATELTTGAPRAVNYFVELQNHAGKTAGPSNAARVVAGPAPPGVSDLRLETRAQGVVLHWDPAAAEKGMVLRIHRSLVNAPGRPMTKEANGVAEPVDQVLEVDLDSADPGEVLDRDAELDHDWKYRAERVVRPEAEGHALEAAGSASETVTIDAKDVFPPAAPVGLAAVADVQGRAIDLSWAPDTEPDLAGYVVYRRDVTASGAKERVSPKALVVALSFTDGQVVAGHRYAYAVSAVDRDGNESPRSGEVEQELPQ